VLIVLDELGHVSHRLTAHGPRRFLTMTDTTAAPVTLELSEAQINQVVRTASDRGHIASLLSHLEARSLPATSLPASLTHGRRGRLSKAC
jgi:hypothetical protein